LILTTSFHAKSDTELSKTITKNYSVDEMMRLSIKNSFGKIEVTNWDKNEFDIVVEITVEGSSQQRAEKKLAEIKVAIDETSEEISFTTDIDDMNNKNGESFEVNYTIRMPASNPVSLKNSFGDIFLSDRRGPAVIDLSYGALKAQSLFDRSEIEVSFGKAYIDVLDRGEITIKYSEVEIESSTDLEMNMEFSDVEIETVEKLELEAKYGSVEIGQVGDLDAEASFNGLSIERLTSSLMLEAKYVSDFEIDLVESSFRLIDIKGKFSSFELNLAPDLSADIEAEFEFSDLKASGVNIDYSYRVKESNESEYRGKINGGNPDKRIIIDSSYGNCKIYQ
jgi:hypothetical protein